MNHFRHMVFALMAAAASWLLAGTAHAQPAPYPSAPIKIVVPWPPGGAADVAARVLAEKVGADLGQAVLVENRPGAGGAIGAQAVARSKPDGYTLLQMSVAHVILPRLQKNMAYDWERDFAPVFGVHATPLVLVAPARSEIRSVADLAALAKSMPAGLSYASGGAGSLSHLMAARLVQAMKLNATHVPYKGIADATQAVVGNQVQFSFVSPNDVIELAKAGNVRLLAVTAEQRHPALPDVPTLLEQNVPVAATSWTGSYVVPANAPSEVTDRLSRSFLKAASDPAVQERLGKLGLALRAKSGAELGAFMRDESLAWRRVIEDNKIKLED